MSRRRSRRPKAKAQRPGPPLPSPSASPVVVRETERAERLAYTRTQAAEALGISRSTFNRRVLPLLETIEMPWGARLIPVDELECLTRERRALARQRERPTATRGRPAARPLDVANRIRAERAAGKSLRQIADSLNATATPTAHGGKCWWPSTVRAVLARQTPPVSAEPRQTAEER
jgi:Recombinase